MREQSFSHAGNNFDALRLLLAWSVVLVHAGKISEAPELAWLWQFISSEMSVKAFFVISGYLIVRSYDLSPDLASYFHNRFLRIYPAYAFVIVGCVMLGAALTILPWEQYFSVATLKYLFWNLLFLNFLAPELPGVFESNPVTVVNGALWSLKIEVMFYVAVPPLLWARKRWPTLPLLTICFVLSVLYSLACSALALQTDRKIFMELQRQLPGQLTFFLVGAAVHFYLPLFKKYGAHAVLIACALYLGHHHWSWTHAWWAMEPLALGVIILFLALIVPYLGHVAKYGDFSYGTYVMHFPIVQAFIAAGLFSTQPWLSLVLSSVLVGMGAYGMWHLVEQPSLRLRRKSMHRGLAA